MRPIIFDAGPLISLTTNNLLWLMEELKKQYGGNFLITKAVKEEIIDKPLHTKKYKFESLQIVPLLVHGVLTLGTARGVKKKTITLATLGNSIYSAKGKNIKIIHDGELESLALYHLVDAQALVMDERVTRMLIEEPLQLGRRLQKRLHTRVDVDRNKLHRFQEEVGNIQIIRSVELVTVAYEKGLLDRYMASANEKYVRNIKRTLIEAVLWGVKLNGCAVSEEEINEIVNLEKAKR